jgi:hypothetical protein
MKFAHGRPMVQQLRSVTAVTCPPVSFPRPNERSPNCRCPYLHRDRLISSIGNSRGSRIRPASPGTSPTIALALCDTCSLSILQALHLVASTWLAAVRRTPAVQMLPIIPTQSIQHTSYLTITIAQCNMPQTTLPTV